MAFESTSRRHNQSQPREPAADPFRDERHLVELKGYLVRSNKAIVDVKVLDLSYDGCAITTLVPLVPGEKVQLSTLGKVGATAATVCWYKARKAGLLFGTSSAYKTRWPRRAERIELKGEVSLRRTGRINYRVAIFDVTRFGCRCEFVERPRVYEHMWIKFDGLESLEATVCWIESSDVGLMYKTPIHPAVFDMLLARQREVAA